MAGSPRRKRASRSRAPENAAVVGFGSQGKAQATRLRRRGYDVRVGLLPRSRSRRAARALGFAVAVPQRAVRGCEHVALLVPDRVAGAVLSELGPSLQPQCLVVLAAGYPLVFGARAFPAACDIVLVAPHGPGHELAAGRSQSGFVAVHQDVTGRALVRARRYARAIGLSPLFETTPRQEALGDLFGEQALLCGGLVGLTAAVARTMVERGIDPAHAYFETTAQLRGLATLLETKGVAGFWEEISDCAAAGMSAAAPRLFDQSFHRRLRQVWEDIESGRFARRFQKSGRPRHTLPVWAVLDRIDRAAKKKGGR